MRVILILAAVVILPPVYHDFATYRPAAPGQWASRPDPAAPCSTQPMNEHEALACGWTPSAPPMPTRVR